MPLLFLGVPLAALWGYAVRQTVRARRRASQAGESSRWQRAGASVLLGLLLLAGFLVLAIGPPWFQATVPPSFIRRTEIRLLSVAEIAYGVAILIAIFAVVPLLAVLIRRRTPSLARSWTARCLMLAFSILVAALVAEGAAVACLWANSIPMPWLPTRFEDRSPDNVVDILVIGESSAQGVPYEKWLSVGDIVAWKLGAALPQRAFQVENQAAPGLSLQAMHTKLAGITRRPELAILYAGHNEFQSRFDWAHGALYYTDEIPPAAETLESLARRISPLCRLIAETAEKLRVSTPPPRIVTRRLVDVPVYTPAEYAERLREFGTRLGAIVSYLEWIGAQVVLVIPPGNDAGFEPNRSFLPASMSRAEREAFAAEFLAARRDETRNPAQAEEAYRRLLERQPRFAESHFRLARLLEQAGQWDEAFPHYMAARDLDGLPMRLPSDFQQTYRDVAAGHPRAILVDGPAEIHASADHGLIDDVFFADGFHPSLNGYTVLAQAILTRLYERRVFAWPAGAPRPVVSPPECAQRFQMDRAKWQAVCGYSAWFYNRMAFARHDPAERLAKSARYRKAASELEAGAPVESVRIPGVGPRAEPVADGRK
ncbi:MAG: tetratricopeptide repeat protein [Isosphaeraceae bacterium]